MPSALISTFSKDINYDQQSVDDMVSQDSEEQKPSEMQHLPMNQKANSETEQRNLDHSISESLTSSIAKTDPVELHNFYEESFDKEDYDK